MDLSTCLTWKNRRVCLTGKNTVPREGEIVHVARSFLHSDDVDLVIRLMDGSVTSVKASGQGQTWKCSRRVSSPRTSFARLTHASGLLANPCSNTMIRRRGS